MPSSTAVRVGNFRQKNNSAEDGIDGTNGYFRRNSGCPAEQKTSEFRSEPFRGRETTRNSVPLDKNRSELSGFPSEHFRGRGKFLSVFTKIEEYSQNYLPNPSAEEKTTRNSVPWKKYRSKLSEFRGRETCSTQNSAAQNFNNSVQCQSNHRGRAVRVPYNFIFSRNSVPFCSVPSFGIGSSAELGMPRNEHFLPRNNGNHSESIPRNFFGTKFRSQP